MIVKTIKPVVDKSCVKKLQHIEDQITRNQVLAKIYQDRLEQYSRKENIKVIGLKEDDHEDEKSLITGITPLGAAIGVEIKEADVSVILRLGKAGGGKNRTVLARFSSRRKAMHS